MKIKVGDLVQVVAGDDKHADLRGEVLRVLPKQRKVVVDGANMAKKHQKPQQVQGGRQSPGGIIEFEVPIDVSNVRLVCPHTNELTRIGVRRDDDGKRVRFSKKSGKDID